MSRGGGRAATARRSGRRAGARRRGSRPARSGRGGRRRAGRCGGRRTTTRGTPGRTRGRRQDRAGVGLDEDAGLADRRGAHGSRPTRSAAGDDRVGARRVTAGSGDGRVGVLLAVARHVLGPRRAVPVTQFVAARRVGVPAGGHCGLGGWGRVRRLRPGHRLDDDGLGGGRLRSRPVVERRRWSRRLRAGALGSGATAQTGRLGGGNLGGAPLRRAPPRSAISTAASSTIASSTASRPRPLRSSSTRRCHG